MDLNQVTLPAHDVEASADFYRRMGFRQIVANLPDYARFECPHGDATFSLHRVPLDCPRSATVVYFETAKLDAEVDRLREAGFTFRQLPTDQPWLWREAYLEDPAGNTVCLFHAGVIRKHPPWRLKE
jgi:catechol 2,3-dioxygenase-like lactoylglutathione lyase family enzyme